MPRAEEAIALRAALLPLDSPDVPGGTEGAWAFAVPRLFGAGGATEAFGLFQGTGVRTDVSLGWEEPAPADAPAPSALARQPTASDLLMPEAGEPRTASGDLVQREADGLASLDTNALSARWSTSWESEANWSLAPGEHALEAAALEFSPRMLTLASQAGLAATETPAAEADAARPPSLDVLGGTFDIVVNYTGNPAYQPAFDTAAARWEQIIIADLPDVGSIDDLQIDASVVFIDGPGRVLGSAGPDALRNGSLLPYLGSMDFDSADIETMANNGTLTNVILHEMGHVLGLGTLWELLGLKPSNQFIYTGAGALAEYRTLSNNPNATSVPLESGGGPGTAGGHWSEAVFDNELMTGFVEAPGVAMPISRMSVASLADLGYTVELGAADPYALPGGPPPPANQPPVITSNGGGDNATVSVAENATAVTTVTANDPQGTALNYALVGGADQAFFQIDATTGVLRFVAAPNFEAPADADRNNSYAVQVRASDGALFDTQSITVNVANVPGITLTASATLVGTAENDTLQGLGGNDVLLGRGDNDILIGGLGNDTIHGEGGDDTAVYSQGLAAYTLQDQGTRVLVAGPDGSDTIFTVEHLRFADGTIHFNDGSALFDTIFYQKTYLDVFLAGVDAKEHYDLLGRYEGRDPNALFSTAGYLGANKDVASAGVNPLEHYDGSGWREGRDPSAAFDTTLYRLRNPDVAAADIDPLAHYLQFGLAEGRQAFAAIGSSIVGGFDAEFYLLSNPDVGAAGVDPLQHFNTSGWREGRDPNAFFDTSGYLAEYADVAAAGINPLEHYDLFGWREGREPSLAFDTSSYLAAYGDVAAADIDPLLHYLTNGAYEGRLAFGDAMWG